MRTHNKLRLLARRDFSGPRRSIPPVRALNRALKDTLKREKALLDSIVADAQHRAAIANGMGLALDPLGVFLDFDHTFLLTEINPDELPPWDTLSEYLKAHIGFQLGLRFGCYSFTVNVHPDLEDRWTQESLHHADRIQRRLRAELEAAGMADLPYFYVIEGKSRTGKSRTKLHIHGYFVTEDPITASKLTPIFERALRRDARRQLDLARTGVDIQRSYDLTAGDRGPGRWVSYVTKNALRPDPRLPKRRAFMSRPLTQLIREFWLLLRAEPL